MPRSVANPVRVSLAGVNKSRTTHCSRTCRVLDDALQRAWQLPGADRLKFAELLPSVLA